VGELGQQDQFGAGLGRPGHLHLDRGTPFLGPVGPVANLHRRDRDRLTNAICRHAARGHWP